MMVGSPAVNAPSQAFLFNPAPIYRYVVLSGSVGASVELHCFLWELAIFSLEGGT